MSFLSALRVNKNFQNLRQRQDLRGSCTHPSSWCSSQLHNPQDKQSFDLWSNISCEDTIPSISHSVLAYVGLSWREYPRSSWG